ncbi:MAG: hypothetical protein ACYDBZ_19975 [Steroidobacteraceae bacterium]
MRYITCLLVSLYLGSAAFAADPEPATPATAPALTPGTASAAQPATTAAPTPPAHDPAADAAKAAAELEKQTKRLRSQGYKPKVAKNGTTLFCRSEPSLGSRFPTERCGTADDLDRAAAYGKETTEDMQRIGNMTPARN